MKPGFSTILSRDFIASIVVFLVAMPLCMGIAVASLLMVEVSGTETYAGVVQTMQVLGTAVK